MIALAPLTEADARSIALWRYEPPYDFYNGAEGEVEGMLDPINHYQGIHVDGELVGYVCVGPDALVAGQEAEPDIDDIGVGFRPDLTGQGVASRWLPGVLDLLDDRLQAPTQRVVIAAWNERSQAVAQRLGFAESLPLSNADGEWVVMTRRRHRGTVAGRSNLAVGVLSGPERFRDPTQFESR